MNFHSVIAMPMDNGFRGRYCHQGGSPIHQVPALRAIVARLGVERATQVLVEQHYGWRWVDPEAAVWSPNARCDPDMAYVEGVGVAYTDHEEGDWYDQSHRRGVVDSVYVLNATSLAVLAATPDGFTHRACISYDALVDPAHLVEIQCGPGFTRCEHYAWMHVPTLSQGDRTTMREHLAARA